MFHGYVFLAFSSKKELILKSLFNKAIPSFSLGTETDLFHECLYHVTSR